MVKLIQSFSNPFLDGFFQLITMVGEDYFFIILMGLVYWCINKDFGYRLGFVYLSSGGINTFLKEIFHIQRLIGEEGIRSLRLETAVGYSFPSGHTQTTATLWTSLIFKVKKVWFSMLAVIIILLVGLSRLYLGVHRPVDVIFGLLIGAGWVIVANKLYDWAIKNKRKSFLLVIILPILFGLIFIKTYTYYKATAVLISFYIGFLIEPVFINFNTNASFWKQVVKLFFGLGILLLLKTYLKVILPEALWSDFLRYFIMGIWVTLIAPYLFKTILGKI